MEVTTMANYTHDEKMDFLFAFAKRYENYVPETKDIMRAETCTHKPNPVRAAQAQLKRIEDRDKFYRRLKAFLQHGIQIYTFEGTQWEKLESDELHDWLKLAIGVYASNQSMEFKNKEITKLANALTRF